MADEEGATAPADAPAPAEKAPVDAVPYERFVQKNDEAKTYKAQLEETQKLLREREEAEMSAAEREKSARERAEQERDSAKAQSERYERSRLVAEAARQAKFNNPELAAEMLAGDGEIDSEAKAAKAVERLAKREPGLLKQEQAPPQIGRVMENGQPVSGNDDKAALDAGIRQLDRELSEALGFTG